MKLAFLTVLLAATAGAAQADDLADGIKAWESQDFIRAHQLLGKLAEAGNTEAQLIVGEMYGFGEGVAEDPAKATIWLNKALQAGHKDAAESLRTLQRRQSRKQDIAYYVSGYTGDDLKLEKYGCTAPAFPEVSRTQTEIKQVSSQMENWSECYDKFSKGLSAVLPAGKVIAPDVAKLMSLGELQQARRSMDGIYAQIGSSGEAEARKVMTDYNNWYGRTQAFTNSMQKKTQDDVAIRMRYLEQLNDRYRAMMSTPGMNGR